MVCGCGWIVWKDEGRDVVANDGDPDP